MMQTLEARDVTRMDITEHSFAPMTANCTASLNTRADKRGVTTCDGSWSHRSVDVHAAHMSMTESNAEHVVKCSHLVVYVYKYSLPNKPSKQTAQTWCLNEMNI